MNVNPLYEIYLNDNCVGSNLSYKSVMILAKKLIDKFSKKDKEYQIKIMLCKGEEEKIYET